MAELRPGELPRIPELANEYELVRELGRGGTAVVYLAREKELGRDVAIKLIRPGYIHDEDAIARLLREARTVGKLQHPSIVMLLGTRRLGDYGLALILQYVPGETLKGRIQARGQLSAQDAERILRDLGSALQYAHTQRIVHREIKPENVYLDDALGLARLADFGIARAWDSDSGLTLPGTAIGTPAYMSPEQVDGKELDGRSDLYSLGLLGYEMLTGRQPWEGESLYSVIYKQKHEALPSISGIRPDVPKNLERAIDGAIQKDPEERWANAGKFLEALAEGSTLPPGALAPGPTEDNDGWESPLEIVEAAVAAQEAAVASETEAPPLPPASAQWTPKPREKPKRGRRIVLGGAAVVAVVLAGVLAMGSADSGSMLDRVGSLFGSMRGAMASALRSGGAEGSGVGEVFTDASVPVPGLSERGLGERSTLERSSGPSVGPPSDGRIPSSLEVLGGDGQVAASGFTLPLPLVVRVTDEEGIGIPGIPVVFDVTSGGGSSVPQREMTASDGTVITRWTLGSEGGEVQSLVAWAEGFAAAGVTFVASLESDSADPALASRAQVWTGGDQEGAVGEPLPAELGIRVLDAGGAPVPDAVVRFIVESGEGQVTPGIATTDEEGIANASWVLGQSVGAQVVMADVDGAPAARARFEATARAAILRLSTVPVVVTGGTHSCSLRSDGSMVCWGGNAGGQLGDGSSSARLVPNLSVQGAGFSRSVSGLRHVCALDLDGEAFCWGANDQGQLGTGNRSSASLPSPVSAPRFTAVSAGVSHTCGLDGAGSVHCWGANESGQLGDGSRDPSDIPRQVAANASFQTVSAGWRHTCALDVQGRAFCWGANESGQLGNGSSGSGSGPSPVGGGHRFRTLAAGNAHTCGLSADGRILCWGANDSGQLGDGTNQARDAPQPVATTANFSSVAAGGNHTCSLTVDGGAMCWGTNVYGQLGDGTTQGKNAPVPVSGFDRFSQIDAFGSHNCGRTPAGDVLCWGYNVEGQIGDGTRDNRLVPTPVSSARP